MRMPTFSADARRSVAAAQECARRLGHNYIGPEHLLLALLDDARERGWMTESLGVDAALLRTGLEDLVGRGSSAMPGNIPFTPRAKKVLALSAREAQLRGDRTVECPHLVLGMVRERDGIPGSLLAAAGVDLTRARAAVTLSAPTAPSWQPSRGGISGGPGADGGEDRGRSPRRGLLRRMLGR